MRLRRGILVEYVPDSILAVVVGRLESMLGCVALLAVRLTGRDRDLFSGWWLIAR